MPTCCNGAQAPPPEKPFIFILTIPTNFKCTEVCRTTGWHLVQGSKHSYILSSQITILIYRLTLKNKSQINFYLLQIFLTRGEMKEDRTQKISHTIDVAAHRYSRMSALWESIYRICDHPDKCHSTVWVLEKQHWIHSKWVLRLTELHKPGGWGRRILFLLPNSNFLISFRDKLLVSRQKKNVAILSLHYCTLSLFLAKSG